jgi:hypothetical protein
VGRNDERPRVTLHSCLRESDADRLRVDSSNFADQNVVGRQGLCSGR